MGELVVCGPHTMIGYWNKPEETAKALQDVAVIGMPHEEWGEAVHAIVILHPDQSATGDELIAHCRERIAGYKLPRGITFRE